MNNDQPDDHDRQRFSKFRQHQAPPGRPSKVSGRPLSKFRSYTANLEPVSAVDSSSSQQSTQVHHATASMDSSRRFSKFREARNQVTEAVTEPRAARQAMQAKFASFPGNGTERRSHRDAKFDARDGDAPHCTTTANKHAATGEETVKKVWTAPRSTTNEALPMTTMSTSLVSAVSQTSQPGAFRIRGPEAPSDSSDDEGSLSESSTSVPPPTERTEGEADVVLPARLYERSRPKDHAASPITVEALPVDKHKQRQRLLLGVVALMVVSVAVIVGVVLGLPGSSSTVALRGVPTPAPTTLPPTAAPTPLAPAMERLVDQLTASTVSVLHGTDSAPAKALSWLSNEANFEDYSNLRLRQRFALATFYYATRGDEWTGGVNGWLTNETECLWSLDLVEVDTTCNTAGELLRFGGITGNNLNGTLPNELGLLTTLETVDIHNNLNLIGSIPSTFGSLSSLTTMKFISTSLTSSIPEELWQLPLIEMDFSFNRLSGSIPDDLSSLSQIKLLDVSTNRIEGGLPLLFSSSLETLNLNSNRLVGPIPESYGNLTALVSLNLAFNTLTGGLSDNMVAGWTAMTSLVMNNNQLRGPLSRTLGTLTRLTALDVHENGFSGTIPTELVQLTNLEFLDLSDNAFTSGPPAQLCQAVNERRIEFISDAPCSR